MTNPSSIASSALENQHELRAQLERVVQEHGPFVFSIPLPGGLWTTEAQLPHTRLRRLVQCAADHIDKPWEECRVLDLGCLDGLFSIEFGLHGCEVVGIEGRQDHTAKARFAARALGLERVTFIQADVREKLKEDLGRFDVSVCSGILYHLDAGAVFELVERLCEITRRVVLIDTHIALVGKTMVSHNGHDYFGEAAHRVHHPRWGYQDGPRFYLTRPSLVNLLQDVGFTSVYECFNPPHLNFGQSGIESYSRCTFVALKAPRAEIVASPAVNALLERWPEDALGYAAPTPPLRLARLRLRLARLLSRRP
jgi:SAM-dependent methyltransferase